MESKINKLDLLSRELLAQSYQEVIHDPMFASCCNLFLIEIRLSVLFAPDLKIVNLYNA